MRIASPGGAICNDGARVSKKVIPHAGARDMVPGAVKEDRSGDGWNPKDCHQAMFGIDDRRWTISLRGEDETQDAGLAIVGVAFGAAIESEVEFFRDQLGCRRKFGR
jgi:hypothetical protein